MSQTRLPAAPTAQRADRAPRCAPADGAGHRSGAGTESLLEHLRQERQRKADPEPSRSGTARARR